eukprot:TRINITY_DN1010_c0_g1_i2.p1 TRINITY_DN1010_c0_g1~~TRINITY_DN1010_c0_g1_i2.p1  ORF type:complete len:169 (-),score=31.37 TRINITY_DN1010_c0_g1_i2:55-534(-)
MSGIARRRLMQERKEWRRNHPHGFYARPERAEDGSTNILKWKCGIPGPADTDWSGGIYPLEMEFTEDYPTSPPRCRFPAGFFHPNIYPSGTVCLSILNEPGWKPSITVPQILLGCQELLVTPNENDPAQRPAHDLYVLDREKYSERIRQQSTKYEMAYS